MSIRDDADIERLDAAMRRFYATRRRSLRWWKHAREYVSLLRLVRNGLLRDGGKERGSSPQSSHASQEPKDGLPSHPPWSISPPARWQEWRWNTPDGKAPFRY